ncbi:MAG: disulfide bond formation protein DsbA [Nanoarchaeota archaeon]|nr:disulfide bond formation protein DsbA [Nanoarchaeota archaeon]|tara:strand:- start:271 stop:996 length:726 start_codon:yes stop_codon:yes gene_type:complete
MDEHNEGSITLKKSSMWKAGTFVFGVLFVISLFTGGFGIGDDGDSGTGNAVRQPTAPSPTIPTGIGNVNAEDLVDDDPFLGDEDAPLTIIEFSDFQCPFCKRARDDAIAQIEEQYVKTGKVKLVYRDFPLTSIHPLAQKAAEASECADDQGKFWGYHDLIFEKQSSLSASNLKAWAVELGLDTDEFDECLDSGKHAAEVRADTSAATSVGGRGTPFFVVGTQTLSGAQPFSAFQAAIEAQL